MQRLSNQFRCSCRSLRHRGCRHRLCWQQRHVQALSSERRAGPGMWQVLDARTFRTGRLRAKGGGRYRLVMQQGQGRM